MLRSSRTTAALLALTVAGSLAATGCTISPTADPGGDPDRSTMAAWDTTRAKAAITALPAGMLRPFDDCTDLLTYYQANALELVTPYGIGPGRGYHGMGDGAVDFATAAAADSAAGAEEAASPASPAAPEHSSTNVQEEGVDEADSVKTDGHVIVAVTNGKVRVVDVATEKLVSTISLPGRTDQTSPQEILLHDGTLVVLSQEWGMGVGQGPRERPAFGPSRTVVTTVDLTDPAAPKTVGSLRLEGSYRSARLIGDTLRMVMVTDPPGVMQTYPDKGTMAAEGEAEERNRELIRSTTIDDWVPHSQRLDASGRVVSTEPLLGCDEISRPRDPAGLSTMSVLSFDLSSTDPAPSSGAGLVATGSTVYASTDRLVVGTSGWDLWTWMGGPAVDAIGIWPGGSPANRTDLHTFDISDPDATRYVASGTVDGRLLSQWALDEEEGVLRVATTTDPPQASEQSHSSLIMLREDGDQLVETGRVDGLGKTEQIRAVRYLSKDLAAVVTFRQTDPLYLIDTSDPTSPQVRGELKIPGYSAYLHPVGDGWLLGVGQDADEESGQTKGLQVSLFDIRDLSAPKQAEVLTWKDSYSNVENDHRAFLSWPTTGQVVVPMTTWTEGKDGNFAGVQVLDVGAGTLTDGGRVSTSAPGQGWGEGALRTLVVGDDLWTLDYQGLSRFDLGTLEGGWVVDLP